MHQPIPIPKPTDDDEQISMFDIFDAQSHSTEDVETNDTNDTNDGHANHPTAPSATDPASAGEVAVLRQQVMVLGQAVDNLSTICRQLYEAQSHMTAGLEAGFKAVSEDGDRLSYSVSKLALGGVNMIDMIYALAVHTGYDMDSAMRQMPSGRVLDQITELEMRCANEDPPRIPSPGELHEIARAAFSEDSEIQTPAPKASPQSQGDKPREVDPFLTDIMNGIGMPPLDYRDAQLHLVIPKTTDDVMGDYQAARKAFQTATDLAMDDGLLTIEHAATLTKLFQSGLTKEERATIAQPRPDLIKAADVIVDQNIAPEIGFRNADDCFGFLAYLASRILGRLALRVYNQRKGNPPEDA